MSKLTAKNLTQQLSRHLIPDVAPMVPDLEASSGNYLLDAKTGKKYLDCITYFASNAIGHNHPAMFEKEFEKRLLRVARGKVSNSDFHTVDLGEFVETFSRVAVPEEFPHLFFIEGGALAVENALKTAFDWKVRKNHAKGLSGEFGSKVLHFRQAFHGRTGYTLSLTNTADPRKTKYFPKFDWPRVSNPKVTFPLSENLEQVIAREKQSLAEIADAFDKYGDDIAAILIEPIQGEGGDNHFRPEFHQALRRIADEREALLIYDEVQTGMGLTGEMWAHEHYGMKPDIVCFGKKTQVCGIMVSRRVEEVENHVFKESSRINSTWGGSITDMVRFDQILKVIERDELVKNAAETGSYLGAQLDLLVASHQDLVSNARGAGLMCAFDLNNPDLRSQLVDKVMEAGVLIFSCGTQSIRLRPSLTTNKAEVDELIAALESALKGIAKK